MNSSDEAAVRCQKVACLALFSDRSAQKIQLDVYEKANGERISARSMLRTEAISASAECGFSSALNLFELKVESTGKNYEIVWDFAGDLIKPNNYDGMSAGLAFFLAFLLQLTGSCCARHPGKYPGGPAFTIAATGILSGATSKAEVVQVAHLEEKLQGALTVLHRGDKLFYPTGNREQVSAGMAAAFDRAGIELIPVATPGEAAGIVWGWLLPKEPIPRRERRHRALGLFRRQAKSRLLYAGLALFSLLLLAFFFYNPFICTSASVLDALEYGEFDKIKLCSGETSDDAEMDRLLVQMRTPLSLTNGFIYMQEDRPQLQDAEALNAMQNVVIDSSTGYRFEIQADKPCFFYLFQFPDNTSLDLLFPASEFALENHFLSDNQLFMIPGGVNYYYFNTSSPRHLVTLCFLGSFWRARDIEELYARYLQAKEPAEIKKLRDRILQRIQNRSRALGKGLRGLYYHQGFFWRQ